MELEFLSGRSPVMSQHAAVATSDPFATRIGLEILKNGGNAADAAVAVAATLSLVDPSSTGLGGDCFVLFYNASDKKVYGINGSGLSPAALTMDLLQQHGISHGKGHFCIPSSSALSLMVPGAAAAWADTVKLFGGGKLNLEEILEPAIKLAEDGFVLHPVAAAKWKLGAERLKAVESFREYLFGSCPAAGTVIRNLELANVFRCLAKEGTPGFYCGVVAERIVDVVCKYGGCLSMEDMRNHKSDVIEPISTNYQDLCIWEMPPSGQGLVALMGLNILENLQPAKEERLSVGTLHKLIESTQLAFADGFRYICDPEKNHVAVQDLLSKSYATQRARLINSERIARNDYYPQVVESGSDTVYFSIVDELGNACSFINSLYEGFGSGLVPENCGFALQNRASNFSLDASHPNCVGPRKRSYHTIIPSMITDKNGDLYACFGSMGAFMQPQAHIQLVCNMVDFNMDPQAALETPRFNILPSWTSQPIVCLEEGIEESVAHGLEKLGHIIRYPVSGTQRLMFGRGQIIQVRRDVNGKRVLWSGSDCRSDGVALGY